MSSGKPIEEEISIGSLVSNELISDGVGGTMRGFNRLNHDFLYHLWDRVTGRKLLLNFINSLFMHYPNQDFFGEDTACIGELFFEDAELLDEMAGSVCATHTNEHLNVLGTLWDGTNMLIVIHLHEKFTETEHQSLHLGFNLHCAKVYSATQFQNVIHIFLTRDSEIKYPKSIVRYRKHEISATEEEMYCFAMESYIYLENFKYWKQRHLNTFETWIMYLRTRGVNMHFDILIDDNPLFEGIDEIEEEFRQKQRRQSAKKKSKK